MKLDHENVLVNYGYDGVSRLTSESWNLGAANPSCNNQYTAQPQGNESGFSNTVRATPSAGILTSPYLASYQYDSAGNRTAKYRLDGGSTYAVDDENRLLSEQPFAVQALTPVTTTTQGNWVELDFGALVAPFRLDVALPDTNRRFRIQWHDGTSYQDISTGAVLGANLEQDGYYRPFSQDCRFLFVSVAMQKIRYWQESGSSAGVSLAAYTIVNGTPIAYAHDANGNMLSRTQGTSVETYAHDYANRIVTYSDQQVAYNYIFAPSGERMAKVNPDLSSEWYMYDGDDVVADYAKPSGGAYSLSATYANGLGIDTKIARYDASGAPSYYIPDALGSVHRILDGSQHVVNTYLTNAWGESLVSQEAIPNRYGFTQRERDSESSLMHYRARSYDPRLGRFVQKDPAGQDLNGYMYTANNPVNAVDPSGKYWTIKKDLDPHYIVDVLRLLSEYFDCDLALGSEEGDFYRVKLASASPKSNPSPVAELRMVRGMFYNEFERNAPRSLDQFMLNVVEFIDPNGLKKAKEEAHKTAFERFNPSSYEVGIDAVKQGISMGMYQSPKQVQQMPGFTTSTWLARGGAVVLSGAGGIAVAGGGAVTVSEAVAVTNAVVQTKIAALTFGGGAAAGGAATSTTIVSRWGRPGLQSGDWVMTGGKSFWNYFWSGKWQPPWLPGKNIPASFRSGQSFEVPMSSLKWPSESNWFFDLIKGVVGQRKY